MLTFNDENIKTYFTKEELKTMHCKIKNAHDILHHQDIYVDSLGWLELSNQSTELIDDIIKNANKIKKQAKCLIVIGIGGSYLGAKAVIDLLSSNFRNEQSATKMKIYFAGNNLSASYLNDLYEIIKTEDFVINVISKSGTTTEPAIAFRYLKKQLILKYGEKEANNRIYVTTDKTKGELINQAKENNWPCLVIPDNIGGRYSVLTPVGLLPILVSGIQIENILLGTKQAQKDTMEINILKNNCYKYAGYRNLLLEKGYKIEFFVSYDPKLQYFQEWLKQLFGESEGKDGQGIFPSSLINTTDLHSLGQYIQDGPKNYFETVFKINKIKNDIYLENEKNNDGLDYLVGKSINEINNIALDATVIAHTNDNIPNMIFGFDEINEYNVGYLIFFFEKACAISAIISGVNPFNQPGVEAYKQKMFELLKK